LLVRHGATLWNATGRFQGQSDVALSPEGSAQAEAIAQRLSSDPIDRIYASDLERSYETARIVAAPHGLEVTRDPRLREFAFGEWEGLTWSEIVATRPHLRDLVVSNAERYRPEGGESYADVSARVRTFLHDLPSGEERVAVVTHAGPLHAMLDVLGVFAAEHGGRVAAARAFAPASLTHVAMEAGGARLITLSDVQHLNSAG
jgi:broad specificity phosphatase PhoE